MDNYGLVANAGFVEMHGIAVPSWSVNEARRMAFNFEGVADAERRWLEKEILRKVKPGCFAFYFGPGTAMDERQCRAILERLSLSDLAPDMLRVETPQVVHVFS